MDHCVFNGTYSQSGYYGGGAVFTYTNANTLTSIVNCTFYNNDATQGGSVFSMSGPIFINNCIAAFNGGGGAIGFNTFNSDEVTITYTDLFGNTGGDWNGSIAGLLDQDGNISEDPDFVDAVNGDVHLAISSPCINAGDPDSPLDPDGTTADMGAFYTVLDYGFTISSPKCDGLCAENDAIDLLMVVSNLGLEDDVYDIVVQNSLPGDWGFVYTTPSGDQSGDCSFSLASGEIFESTVEIITADGSAGADGWVTFVVTSQGNPDVTQELTFYVMSTGKIFIVNADPDGNYSSYYTEAIESCISGDLDEIPSYSCWNLSDRDLPCEDIGTLNSNLIIWYLGDGSDIGGIYSDDLIEYLNSGNKLWITGSTAANVLTETELMDLLGAELQSQYPAAQTVEGVEGDPVGDGISFSIGGGDGADNVGTPASLVENGGTTCLRYNLVRRCGIRNEGENGYQTLLMSFPFEAIAAAEDRTALMTNTLLYFGFDLTPVYGSGEMALPSFVSLEQNYPNPFNSSTTIYFNLPEQTSVNLNIYNMLGQQIAAVVKQRKLGAGRHSIVFEHANLATGQYLYVLKTSKTTLTKQMLYLK